MSAALRLYRGLGRFATALRLERVALRGSPRELEERRGYCPPGGSPPPVWVHAASLGELDAARPLLAALRESGRRTALSTMTRTGLAKAAGLGADVGPFHVPLDAPGPVGRCLDRLRPAALVSLETEIWPTLLSELSARDVVWAIVSARLSPRGAARMRRVPGLYRAVLGGVGAVAARTEGDASRYVENGAPAGAVRVTGDLKEDEPPPPFVPPPDDLPRFVAACTRPGEEEIVLAALEEIERSVPEGELLLAPRHPERFAPVADLVRAAGRDVRVWEKRDESPAPGGWRVLLVDRMGVLDEAYRWGSVAFVGGSLVPRGGHSPLPAAAAGRPILYGPHDENCRDAALALEREGGLARVASASDLAAQVVRLLRDPRAAEAAGRRAHETLRARSGATERTVAWLEERGVLR